MANPPPATVLDASDSARPGKLPARILNAIRAQQESSEILIGWIQLAIVLTFTILYLLSPKPHGDTVTETTEPWILGAYIAFTALRLGLAYRRLLPAWLLHLSVVIDMALLLALIWSFHLKYGQPASFYLKVPTLLYVFIFIALRALRFETRYVLSAGFAAAAGWLLMVTYAVRVDSSDPMITRDYVEYMTSNSVLLGAEFDKVISILMVTLILALAIARARDLLVQAVADHSAAVELSRFVPDRVAEQVRSADAPVQAGQGAGEGDEEAAFDGDAGGFGIALEVVHGPADLAGVLLAEYLKHLRMRFAGVEDDRQVQALCKVDVLAEYLILHRVIRGIRQVVQPDLGYANDAGIVADQGLQTGVERVVNGVVGVHGVDAHAGVEHRMFVGQGDATLGGFHGGAGEEDVPDAGVVRALEDAGQFGRIELFVLVEMRMGVAENGGCGHGAEPPASRSLPDRLAGSSIAPFD